MAENITKRVKIYQSVGKAGSFLLFAGCFCPILAGVQQSFADVFVASLGLLSRGDASGVGVDAMLSFMALLIASRCLFTALMGDVADLRSPAVQAWVVLLVSYTYYFGLVFPVHFGADWGWSVLFLGATLVAFGSFRSHAELEEEPESATEEPREPGRSPHGKRNKT
ncbi:MAG: hypothetical protein AB1646_22015 [Thermodesulfobacteriota bacterium]